MISEILPGGVEAVEVVGDDPTAELLWQEDEALGRVSDGRRRDFTTGRSCARRALVRLGLPPSPLLRGPNREPLWPPGVVGSITHCPNYGAAAVTKRGDFVSIGIDAEPNQELPRGVLQKIALPEEQRWLRLLSGTGVCWDRFLFSAKESVFKTWFPITGRWLGFEDAVVQVNQERGTFHAHLLVEGPVVGGRRVEGFDGRFCVADGFLLTFVGVAAEPPGREFNGNVRR